MERQREVDVFLDEASAGEIDPQHLRALAVHDDGAPAGSGGRNPGRDFFCLRAVSRPDVETAGDITCGMTVIDSRPFRSGPTNAEVVTELDVAAVIDYFCRGVRRIAVSSDGRS